MEKLIKRIRNWSRKKLEEMAAEEGETVVIVPKTGAALVLREGEPLTAIMPDAKVFLENPLARSYALVIGAAGVMLRDGEENLSYFEALVRAMTEFGFPYDEARKAAGELVNPDVPFLENPA